MKCEVCGELGQDEDVVSLRVGTAYTWGYVDLCREHALAFALRGVVEIRCSVESMANNILADDVRPIAEAAERAQGADAEPPFTLTRTFATEKEAHAERVRICKSLLKCRFQATLYDAGTTQRLVSHSLGMDELIAATGISLEEWQIETHERNAA